MSECKITISKTKNRSPKFIGRFLNKSGANCNFELNAKYIIKALERSSHIAYAWRRSGDYTKKEMKLHICGIGIIEIRDDSCEIWILCSNKGYGGKILRRIEDFAKNNGVLYTYLYAVDTAESYYKKKHNYKYSKNACNNTKERRTEKKNAGVLMSKCLYNPEELKKVKAERLKILLKKYNISLSSKGIVSVKRDTINDYYKDPNPPELKSYKKYEYGDGYVRTKTKYKI